MLAIRGQYRHITVMTSAAVWSQEIEPIVDAIMGAQRPVLYVGGGCLDCPDEVRELVARTGIPVTQTLMGLGAFPESHPLALQVVPSPPTTGLSLLAALCAHTCSLLWHGGYRVLQASCHVQSIPPNGILNAKADVFLYLADAGHAWHSSSQLRH